MSEDLKKKIINDIKKTGFPLELEISKQFTTRGWSVSHSSYYIDRDEHKGREIDLITDIHKSEFIGKNKEYLEVNFSLIIEIKQANEKPWVIFQTKASRFEWVSGFPRIFKSEGFKIKKHEIARILAKYGSQNKEYLGRSFYEAFTGNGGRDDIFKALSGTVKALNHFHESCSVHEANGNGDRLLYLYEPVVVIKGKLFEATLNDNLELNINEVDYSQVNFNYLSPNYEERRYVVHIVTSNQLTNFIEVKKQSLKNIFLALKEQEKLTC